MNPRGRPPKTERNNKIIEALESGDTYEEIAEQYNLRVPSVKQIVKHHAPELYEKHRKSTGRPLMTDEDIFTDRNIELVKRIVEDNDTTLASIGREYSLSRERVRQLVNRIDPEGYEDRKRRIEEIREQKRAEREARRQFVPFECSCCGTLVTNTRRKNYCGDDCRVLMSQTLRYHIDPEYKERHRGYVSRWVLDNQDKVAPTMVNHAQRVLNGDAETRGSWFTKDSKGLHGAIRAYKGEWPVFDLLSDDLKNQVKSIVDGDESDEE